MLDEWVAHGAAAVARAAGERLLEADDSLTGKDGFRRAPGADSRDRGISRGCRNRARIGRGRRATEEDRHREQCEDEDKGYGPQALVDEVMPEIAQEGHGLAPVAVAAGVGAAAVELAAGVAVAPAAGAPGVAGVAPAVRPCSAGRRYAVAAMEAFTRG